MHWSYEFDEVMRRLGWPDLGDWKVWRWWFARSLSMLEEHGWFELLKGDSSDLTTGELTPERDTIFALRWMAEDFCDVVDGYGAYEPCWDDWFEAFQIPRRSQVPAARKHKAWPEIEGLAREEIGVPSDPSDYEDEDVRQIVEDELDACLTTQSMLLLIAEKRRSIVRLLAQAWGGHHRLYQSLFATVHSDPGLIESDNDDLYEDDEVDGDPHDLQAFQSLLEHWRGMAVNELAHEALELPDSLAGLGERLAAHGWVYEDCPVRVQGDPPFLAIQTYT